jgi:hypothetical protein
MPIGTELVRTRGKLYTIFTDRNPMIEVLHLMGLTRPKLLRNVSSYSHKSDVRNGMGNHPRLGYYAELLRHSLEDPLYMAPLTNSTALETGRAEYYCSSPKHRPYPFSIFSPKANRAKFLQSAAPSSLQQ